ncbi:MAG: hypothetical protein DMG84_17645 [Acidobacteria bacterium]|nr:MAG: hypothetical protein AUI17_06595 [Acidobacteriales bacterium 13_2_20CM_2_55_5]OLD16938.1 MAG: hypothetical protein AUI85_08400 [Acidobacteriales bacterium 13_1_40CM_3_55_5]PYX11496.1 MAG: hypothetical protein DMG85_05340 [Acidobacteriota bacterium]PYX13819.1 MAG: hypothetical protein DMG84_17645 [Acidobacteriota bacterium]
MKCKLTIVTAPVFAILLYVGCSRQLSDENTNTDQLPFEYTADKTGISPTASLIPAELPPGTQITIRLQAAISSIASHSGDGFDAVLDKPILFQGQTIAPAGSAVRGKVLAAKASGRSRDPGFLRITLTEISLKGRVLSLQTSSIFAKGISRERRKFRGGADAVKELTKTAGTTSNKDAGFSTEERLTFRLTQPWPGQS